MRFLHIAFLQTLRQNLVPQFFWADQTSMEVMKKGVAVVGKAGQGKMEAA